MLLLVIDVFNGVREGEVMSSSLGLWVGLRGAAVEDVEDVVHSSFVEVEGLEDEWIDGVVHLLSHVNKIITQGF